MLTIGGYQSMPIYEYQCTACDKEIEVLQKISDAPLQTCPVCGESALKKKISAAAFRLKGGGWYETDFKTGDKKNLAGGSDKPASPAGGDKPAKPSDSDSKKSA
jgi:putative FmdB family regulatory protein